MEFRLDGDYSSISDTDSDLAMFIDVARKAITAMLGVPEDNIQNLIAYAGMYICANELSKQMMKIID